MLGILQREKERGEVHLCLISKLRETYKYILMFYFINYIICLFLLKDLGLKQFNIFYVTHLLLRGLFRGHV